MGRAPTSGNCHTCRSRRVKCDRIRPACERCIKAGYECEGYAAVLRIQSHSVVPGDKPGTSCLTKIQAVSSFPFKKPPISSKPPRPPRPVRTKFHASVAPISEMKRLPQPQSPQEPQNDISGSSNAGSSPSQRSISGNNGSRAASLSPPPELSLAGFVDDMAFSYFFDHYGWINMHSILLQDSSVRRSLSDDDMSHDSLRALACGLLGKDHHIQHLQSHGARLYGNTLKELRAKLSNPNKDELATLIKPIAIMGSYSISVENDLRFTHHRGLSRILEHCGPECFQSPSLLPVFDSCRLTMISNCIVRRTPTFLSKEEWKTVPWEKAPHLKSWTSKLLDLMTDIPNLISAVLTIMDHRITWHNNGFPMEQAEDPDEVPALQRRVEAIKEGLANWRMEWEAAHPQASNVLAWAFSLTGDDKNRPGIHGYAGPDLYEYSMLNAPASPPTVLNPDRYTFALMQDVSLYTTVLIWADRLTKYLAGAAISHTNIDFYNSAFSTTCRCCTSKLAEICDTVPDSDADVLHISVTEPSMSWNCTAARIAIAPIRVSPRDDAPVPLVPLSPTPTPERDLSLESPHRKDDRAPSPELPLYVRSLPLLPSSPPQTHSTKQQQTIPQSPPVDLPPDCRSNDHSAAFPPLSTLPTPPVSATFAGGGAGFPQRMVQAPHVVRTNPPMLLPGDVRFSSQLRVLGWLTDHLPASRPQVLSTLASIGLGHCGHDVRPVDGLPEVSNVVRKALYRTKFEHTDSLMLRRYR